jgi:glycerol-1-phosphate dehydrogenase [NAD(P)+]
MFSKAVSLPIFWIIGDNVMGDIKDVLSQYNMVFHRPLVVTGSGKTAQLGQKFFSTYKRIAIETNHIADVEKVKAEARSVGSDLLIGFGGGKVIDVAKMAATELNLPFLSVPTATSNDAVASPVAVINFGDYVKSMGASAPIGVVADLNILRNQPHMQFLAGVGDLFSNISALEDWKLASERGFERVDPVAAYLSRNAVENLFRAIENGDDLNGVLVEGLVVSGVSMILAGNSRPSSGAEHLISHALDRFPVHSLHGLQVGVAAFFTLRLHGLEYCRYRNLLRSIGFPTTWGELGIDKDTFMKAVEIAPETRSGRYTILSEVSPSLLQEAYDEVYGVGTCGDGQGSAQ